MFQRKLTKETIHQLYLKYATNFFTLKEMKDGLLDLISHLDNLIENLGHKKSKTSTSNTASGKHYPESSIGSYVSQKQTEQVNPKPSSISHLN